MTLFDSPEVVGEESSSFSVRSVFDELLFISVMIIFPELLVPAVDAILDFFFLSSLSFNDGCGVASLL